MEELINQYILGDAFEYLPKIKDKSVDLVFTGIPDIHELGEIGITEYQNFIEQAISEISRIVKDEGFVVFSQTDRKIDGTIFLKHHILLNKMLALGFIVKDYKILVKDDIEKINLYRLNYSHVLILTRTGTIAISKKKGNYLKDIWVFPLPSNKNFWNEDFCELIISTLTDEGDFIVDPFAGRGTALKVAKKLNRRYFGTEILKDVYNLEYVQS